MSAEEETKKVAESEPTEPNVRSLSGIRIPPALEEKFTSLLSHLPPGTADKVLEILLKQGPTAARAAVDLAIAKSRPGGVKIGLILFRKLINQLPSEKRANGDQNGNEEQPEDQEKQDR
jgi:hypothetical protein